jgi:predicted nucleic acid-binding protein
VTVARLDAAIPAGASLLVDTSVALAYLTGTERTSRLATELFDAFVARGRNPAALSVVSVQEILVRPFRRGPGAVAVADGFLRHFAQLRLIDVDYAIAREAARIRAASGIRAPDALIIATASVAGIEIVVTNDRSWRPAVESNVPGLQTCLLADLGSA